MKPFSPFFRNLARSFPLVLPLSLHGSIRRETCRARQTAEATRMAALVSEIKSRQASKANKSRQQSSAANPTIGGSALDSNSSERGGPIGGIMLGERGKEMIRERQREKSEGSTGEKGEEKSSGSWFGGRI